MATTIVHGANKGSFRVVGQTVRSVRRALREVFNIPDDASALINGGSVGDDRILADGEHLEFTREYGTKGLGALLTPEQLRELWAISKEGYEELLTNGLPTLTFSKGSVRHPEAAVDEFLRILGRGERRDEPREEKNSPDPWLLTVSDLAALLQISEREVWRKRASGKLPEPVQLSAKHIRWDREEVRAWIAAGCPTLKFWKALKVSKKAR